jgi:hypothetical protein
MYSWKLRLQDVLDKRLISTFISLVNVEAGINVEGVPKMENH